MSSRQNSSRDLARTTLSVLGIGLLLSEERGDAIVTLSGKAILAVALGIIVTAAVQSALSGIGLFAVAVPFAGVLTAMVFILCIAQLGPLLAMPRRDLALRDGIGPSA